MTQTIAEERAAIAGLRNAVRLTASSPPMSGIKLMMSAEDIAAIMPNATADTVRDKHRQWTRKNGFPAPIPGMSPLVWSGPQIIAWLRGKQEVTIEHAPVEIGLSELQRKYGGGR